MGSSNPTYDRNLARVQAKYEKEEAIRISAVRMALANKIVMAVIDKIASDIIRPGPKPEERECYVMAQELRDTTTELTKLVSAILKVEEEEKEKQS